ncbi:DUF302 domain-containing protein [Thermococcus sp.]|uniref:DUF302 domain-containing protein n=2 Tax=Thermococcus sp. TaxID=35749 RepID=UPI00261A1D2D|nr:DUF302 domain-containing protein [Thermococcus sp.]
MFGYRRKLDMGLKEAEEKFKAKLEERAYRVVMEFTPSDVVKAKLGVEMEPYRLLYVCNPKKFYDMTKVEYEIGSFAPCPMLLYEKDGEVYIAINTAEDIVDVIRDALEDVKAAIEEPSWSFPFILAPLIKRQTKEKGSGNPFQPVLPYYVGILVLYRPLRNHQWGVDDA